MAEETEAPTHIDVVQLDELRTVLKPLVDMYFANEAMTNDGRSIQNALGKSLVCGINLPVQLFLDVVNLLEPEKAREVQQSILDRMAANQKARREEREAEKAREADNGQASSQNSVSDEAGKRVRKPRGSRKG